MTLTEKMAKYEELRLQMEALEAEIKTEVLALGKTQKFGHVVATYSQGRGSYAYDAAARAANVPAELVARFTTPSVDWRAVCKEADVPVDAFYTPGTPGVSLKLAF